MNNVYMSISVTYFNHGIAPMCRFYESLDGQPCTARKLKLKEAQKLMWELKLAGGTRTYRSNQFAPSIHTVTVDYYACL